MIPVAFCIPGRIDLPTGGYRYDREVMARLPAHGVEVSHLPLGEGFPHPTEAEAAQAIERLRAVSPRSILLIDGLALGALPPEDIAALPHRIVALVHHPLGLEAGTPPDRAAFLLANEKAVLAEAAHVIATSDATRRILKQDFAVPQARITVAEPGVERRSRSAGSGGQLHILAVGAVSPRKAYGDLVHALAGARASDWRLTIAGSLTLAPDGVAALRGDIEALDLGDRITLAGAVDDASLAALFNNADVFAMSSLFEGYGMALAEALAHGLPIVTTTGGAAADTVPDAAALKVPPGDVAGLSAALGRVLGDTGLRRRMADASYAAAALLPSWDDTARGVAEALRAP